MYCGRKELTLPVRFSQFVTTVHMVICQSVAVGGWMAGGTSKDSATKAIDFFGEYRKQESGGLFYINADKGERKRFRDKLIGILWRDFYGCFVALPF